jgi:hypothetical protein
VWMDTDRGLKMHVRKMHVRKMHVRKMHVRMDLNRGNRLVRDCDSGAAGGALYERAAEPTTRGIRQRSPYGRRRSPL